MKSKHSMTSFFVISFLHYMAASFVHPITPTLIVSLKLPVYMFGAAFAAMALTGFLFSPFWGKLREFFSARLLLLIGSVGYSIGQILFNVATDELGILFARIFSGFFIGAIGVSTLIYVTELPGEEESGVYLAKFAIVQSLGGASGFLLGGLTGVLSLKLTFWIQSACLLLCGVLYYFLLKENSINKRREMKWKAFAREINPIKSFLDCRNFMTKSFALLFIVITLAIIGITVFDQAFNFYLKAQLGFSSVYNGAFKAIIGLITLAVNSTICMWIIRHGNIKKAAGIILICCSVSIFSLLGISGIPLFFGICILYYSFQSAMLPLLQDSVAHEASYKNRNMVMGLYNSLRSLGMVCGALLSGFVYDYHVRLPFALAGVCFGLAALFLVWSDFSKKREE